MDIQKQQVSTSIKPSFTPAPSGLLQRKCACGNHTMAGGECAECGKKKQFGLQTKLKINEPGDIYEQEADRIADQVMAASPNPVASVAPQRIQRFAGQPAGQVNTAPASVDQALASSGRPLESALRQDMEHRFGYDFSRVRVHSGADAEQSAGDVNAKAYTMGNNIVFGAGWFAPETHQGRRLIAHELTHVVQQSGSDGIHLDQSDEKRGLSPISTLGAVSSVRRSIQRACGPASIGSVGGCIGRSGDITEFGGSSANLFLFKVNCDTFAPGEESRLRSFAAGISADDTLAIDGFASEEGDPVFNDNLSCARARAAWKVLDQEGVQAQPALFKHGATRGNRDVQRSAVITQIPVTPAAPAPEATPERPKHICGPNVTTQVEDVLNHTRALFRGWSGTDKGRACSALVEPPEAAFAWDILDLHKNAWILEYRCSPPSSSCPVGTTVPPNPVCASWGATPSCGSTVQVGKECYYAGSANYVIWGVMCKLCRDEFGGTEFSESAMRGLVDLYKLWGLKGDNVATAKAWATAGYQGWPSGGTPPRGDKSNCSPTCPTPYQGSAFRITWCPHENPYSECLSMGAAIESIIEHVF